MEFGIYNTDINSMKTEYLKTILTKAVHALLINRFEDSKTINEWEWYTIKVTSNWIITSTDLEWWWDRKKVYITYTKGSNSSLPSKIDTFDIKINNHLIEILVTNQTQ